MQEQRGSGYIANDTITIQDPSYTTGTLRYATLTIGSINETGLTLCDGKSTWQTGTANSNYISNENINYNFN